MSTPRKVTMPAGTVYLMVEWSEEAWPLVKSGAISGYSLGGRAMRVVSGDDLPAMGDKQAAAMDEYVDSNGDGMCDNCGKPESEHE